MESWIMKWIFKESFVLIPSSFKFDIQSMLWKVLPVNWFLFLFFKWSGNSSPTVLKLAGKCNTYRLSDELIDVLLCRCQNCQRLSCLYVQYAKDVVHIFLSKKNCDKRKTDYEMQWALIPQSLYPRLSFLIFQRICSWKLTVIRSADCAKQDSSADEPSTKPTVRPVRSCQLTLAGLPARTAMPCFGGVVNGSLNWNVRSRSGLIRHPEKKKESMIL